MIPQSAPAPPRLPRALALRIDRLAWRAHAFHRWAHHPLCAAYRSEVVALGPRLRVCRGCLYAALGLLAGAAAGLAVRSWNPWTVAGGICLDALAAALPWALPRIRAGKAVTRLLPTALAAFLACQGARRGGGPGWLLVLALFLALLTWLGAYRRRGPWRGACAACPEASRPAPCSGFRAIVARERAFQRLAGGWIQAGSTASASRPDRGQDR